MIYLAGSCSSEQRTLMVTIAEFLRKNNQDVYCPFELKIPNAWDYPQEEWAKMVFNADKAAIDKCDLFLMISPGRTSTAGTNWEQGYAYALGKKTVIVQYTEDKTSLMTYCGCTKFINTTKETILVDIYNIINDKLDNNNTCKTILT